MNTREIVMDVLLDVTQNGKHSHVALSQVFQKYNELEKRDRAFIGRLTHGTLERKLGLDYDLERFSKIPVNKMKPLIRTVLEMSMYQIKYMTQTPESAVCNEAVKLVKKRGFQNLSGFVNGVLRHAVREKEQLSVYPKQLSKAKRISLEYSMPEWIVNDWLSCYEEDVVRSMLASFFEEETTSIRVNLNKITKEELRKELEDDGICVMDGHYCNAALHISGYERIEDIKAFQMGYFQVQDESSMLVSLAADVQAGNQIIDVCAAPGGKSLHIADLLKTKENALCISKSKHGVVIARDISDKKIDLIQENILRTQTDNVIADKMDALVYDPNSKNSADIVIADLPCSGLGVIGKKADIKYNMTKDQQRELAALQKEILSVVSSYVKPGGVLMYSTCTISALENEENVKFIKEKLKLQPECLTQYLPEQLRCLNGVEDGYLQLLPGIQKTDGFFLSRFRKKSMEEE